jgi:acetyltransferase-like isoleucine patch superfamily enzyme
MNLIYRATQFFGRAFARLYSQVVSSQFAAWGANSRLGLGAKLVGPQFICVGQDVTIGCQAWLNAKDDRGDGMPTLNIGRGTYIGRSVQINAWRSVAIGNNVLIADRVLVTDADHIYENPLVPILAQGDYFRGPVNLSDGCWIGIGAVILPGVTVGRNAIVAANAVVAHDVPDLAIAAGVPARIIKHVQAT